MPLSLSPYCLPAMREDYWLCKKISSLNKLGGSVVLELYKG